MIVYLLFFLLGVLVASVVGFELCLCLGVLVAFVVGFLYGRKSVSTVALQSQSANGKSSSWTAILPLFGFGARNGLITNYRNDANRRNDVADGLADQTKGTLGSRKGGRAPATTSAGAPTSP